MAQGRWQYDIVRVDNDVTLILKTSTPIGRIAPSKQQRQRFPGQLTDQDLRNTSRSTGKEVLGGLQCAALRVLQLLTDGRHPV